MRDSGNNLPWQYKYTPKSTEELAVNKSKVQQVRKWLEDVFHGASKRRLLILTGPAGAGKTATMECLSKELGFDLLEWRNPTTNADGLHGSDLGGYSSLFEEFLARAGKWNCLEIFRSDGKKLPGMDASTGNARKVIVIEDFPNTLTPSSAPLLAFQHSVKSFLALPPEVNPSPLVLIISESASVTGSNAFTAYRLLGPTVLNSYLVSEIKFQPIAKTFMVKALENVIHKESKDSGRRWGPSRPIIEKIGEIGDIRSAIASLEFMSVTGDDAWIGETRIGTKAKTKRANTKIGVQFATL
jgi:cell cycle checkpoint protein